MYEEFRQLQIKYQNQFRKYGDSPKSLFWYTDKMNIRFYELANEGGILKENTNFSVLDVGGGFGMFYQFLIDMGIPCDYLCIDLVEEFVQLGRQKFGDEKMFVQGNFLTHKFDGKFDYIVASGIFNYRLIDANDENYDFIFSFLEKAFLLCNKSIIFNFVTDQVEFRKENVAYHSPTKVLQELYKFSNKISLSNTCMPFECTCALYCNNEIDYDLLLFKSYKEEMHEHFEKQFFSVSFKGRADNVE